MCIINPVDRISSILVSGTSVNSIQKCRSEQNCYGRLNLRQMLQIQVNIDIKICGAVKVRPYSVTL